MRKNVVSVAMYEDSLRAGTAVLVRSADGSALPLDVPRWQGPARGADGSLLDRVHGPALDIGCGPGRLVAALARRGVFAVGIDIAPVAVRLTRAAGGYAVQRSVFEDVPYAGSWKSVVLADGNIGIGGDPVRLLRRSAELLAPEGDVLVELAAPSSGVRLERIRLEHADGRTGPWFRWARVAADAIAPLAARAGLSVVDAWSAPDPPVDGCARWFAALSAT